MEKTIKRPVILGGMVMDFRGRPKNKLQLYTSNPGLLHQTPGGVGRNIAENLARLGLEPLLISAVGRDLTGDSLLLAARNLGLATEGILQLAGEDTAIYLAVIDEHGDLHTAIAGMEIFEQLTPERIAPFTEEIVRAPLVIVDTNLPLATLCMVAELCKANQVPLLVEPVSVEKSQKIVELLGKVSYISPNLDELLALTTRAVKIDSNAVLELREIENAARELVAKGVQNVLVTLGKDGVLLANAAGISLFPALPAKAVDVTGAGDAFVAGFAYGVMQGFAIEAAVNAGLTTAKLTVEAAETVCTYLSSTLLNKYIKGV